MNEMTQKHTKPSLQHMHKLLCKEYKGAKSMEGMVVNYHARWLSLSATKVEGMYKLSKW